MLLYNGSPVTLKANAEGVPHVIESKKTLFVPNDFRARVLLDNLGPLGLKEIQSKDDAEEADPECVSAYLKHVEKSIQDFNDHRTEQKRQGLRTPTPGQELVRHAGIYAKLGGTVRLSGTVGITTTTTVPEDDDEDELDANSEGALRTRRSSTRGGRRR